MKKTLTVNLSGTVFHIDEDAYFVLNDYLKSIRKHFSATEGREEILSDIEARIAEMLHDRIGGSKQVITIDDIEEVIRVIGQPSEFGEEAEENNGTGRESGQGKTTKRLYRDPDHSVLGGVCGGLGAYFHTDPVWFRLAFVIAFFPAFGTSLLVYLILWVVIPEAKSTAEKLEMKGEKVNISNIEKSIKEEIENLKNKFNEFTREARNRYKKKSENGSSIFRETGDTLTSVALLLVKIALIFTGVILSIAGIVLVFTFLFLLFGFGNQLVSNGSDLVYVSLPVITDLILGQGGNYIFITGLGLLFGVPLLMILYSGIKLIFGLEKTRYVGFTALYLWLAGLIITLFFALRLGYDFHQKSVVLNEVEMALPEKHALYIQAEEDDTFDRITRFGESIFVEEIQAVLTPEDRNMFFGIPELKIGLNENQNIHIEFVRKSRGKSNLNAKRRAEKIVYDYSVNDSMIKLAPCFTLSGEEVWRNQELEINVKIPEGCYIHTGHGLERMLDKRRVEGKIWKMTRNGLIPVETNDYNNDIMAPPSEKKDSVPGEVKTAMMSGFSLNGLILFFNHFI
ncbi:MAG: PspC domain-containing protein [Bacteroidales bacterium]|nr:PspC domain-containing protein [Bacteroidales bacterium]